MAWNESKKIRLTVDSTKITTNLPNFPVSVYLSASSGLTGSDVTRVFDELGTDDQKIAVYTYPGQSGGTECYIEVEFWNDTTDEALLHVKVPTVTSGTDTSLFLYYDSGQADNTTYVGYPGDAVAQNVWDSDFEVVFHLANDPSASGIPMKDSTSNNRDGTPTNMDATNLKDGDIGKAIEFDGSTEYISFTNLGSISQWTITAKFKTDVVGQNQTVASQDRSGWNDDILFGIEPEAGYGPDNVIGCVVHNDTGSVRDIVSNDTPVTNTNWYVASVRSTASVMYLYVDGVEKDTEPGTNIGMGDDTWQIGDSPNVAREFDGRIEELRISSTARSAAWVIAESYSLYDNLITYEVPIAANCEGTVQVDDTLTSGIVVRLYTRDDGELVGSTVTTSSGTFSIPTFSYEDHYAIALYTISGTNALIYDWLVPTTVS